MQNSHMSSRKILFVKSKQMQAEHIGKVISGELLALRIPNFYPRVFCRKSSTMILLDPTFTANKKELNKYYGRAINDVSWLKSMFNGIPSPFYQTRYKLEEWWSSPVLSMDLSHFFTELMIFTKGCSSLPHCDRLEWDNPTVQQTPMGQLALVVYLRVPRLGGELVLWSLRPDRRLYDSLRLPDNYGLNQSVLPAPIATIKPVEGELIIFNTQKVHCVRSGSGPRITVSFFVIYTEKKELKVVGWF